MISFFPVIYDDELLYSALSRWHLHSGNLTYRQSSRKLFSSCAAKPNYELYNDFTENFIIFMKNETGQSIGDIILEHTLLKHYARFYSNRSTILSAVSKPDTTIINSLSVPQYGKRFLRYCPACVEEQRQKYGECYFTCSANLYGINACPIHGCRLVRTELSTDSKKTPAFITAEEIIPFKNDVVQITNPIEIGVVRYIIELFQAPFIDVETATVGTFLKENLQPPYVCPRGEVMNRSMFWNDFLEYYQGIDLFSLTELWQMSKIFQNKRKITHEIALVAFFEGIQVEELASPKPIKKFRKDAFDDEVHRLHNEGLNYRRISEHLGASYDYVKAIGEGKKHKKNLCS